MTSRETAPRFAGIGGHHSAKAGTVEWLTPPSIIAALGPFDLDPCAPETQPYPTARRTFTRRDNGLIQRWAGRVWLNPPYTNGEIGLWLARMAEHDRGTALIFARTETEAFFRHVWDRAAGLLFMEGRINFIVGEPFVHPRTGRRYEIGDVAPGNAGAPTVLCAYGQTDAEILAAAEIDGKFVPLVFPRSVLVEALAEPTWRELVERVLRDAGGEAVDVADVWRAIAAHPKAAGKQHGRAKVRQVLQQVAERVERGTYRLA